MTRKARSTTIEDDDERMDYQQPRNSALSDGNSPAPNAPRRALGTGVPRTDDRFEL